MLTYDDNLFLNARAVNVACRVLSENTITDHGILCASVVVVQRNHKGSVIHDHLAQLIRGHIVHVKLYSLLRDLLIHARFDRRFLEVVLLVRCVKPIKVKRAMLTSRARSECSFSQ